MRKTRSGYLFRVLFRKILLDTMLNFHSTQRIVNNLDLEPAFAWILDWIELLLSIKSTTSSNYTTNVLRINDM